MAKQPRQPHKILKKHLHSRIFTQLIIYAVITVVMFALVIIDALTNHLNLWWILLGTVIGIVLGFLAGRAFTLHWHEDSGKIIMNIDRTGFFIIILYVLIRTLMNSEAKQLFDGVELLAVTYSLLGGVMVGRIVSMARKIVAILRGQGII